MNMQHKKTNTNNNTSSATKYKINIYAHQQIIVDKATRTMHYANWHINWPSLTHNLKLA